MEHQLCASSDILPRHSRPALQVNYAYDQAGNRFAMAYPGGTAPGYTPMPVDQASQITMGSNPFVEYGYHGNQWYVGQRKTITSAGVL
ncbi:MAG: hypothetical protein AMXMBFR13_27750 [Phycisphaerae bacterium]